MNKNIHNYSSTPQSRTNPNINQQWNTQMNCSIIIQWNTINQWFSNSLVSGILCTLKKILRLTILPSPSLRALVFVCYHYQYSLSQKLKRRKYNTPTNSVMKTSQQIKA